MNVVVTDGSGRVGRYIVSELVAHGYDVTNADRVGAPQEGVRFIRVESTDLGEIVAAFKGAETVVHMAAIPDPLYRSRILEHLVSGNHAAAPVLGESAWRTAAGVRWPWRSTSQASL